MLGNVLNSRHICALAVSYRLSVCILHITRKVFTGYEHLLVDGELSTSFTIPEKLKIDS